jgi:hypothetical protein
VRLNTAPRNAAADGIVDQVDVGAGANGTLELWSGAYPGTVGGAPAGTLLASFNYNGTAFGAAVAGVATANGMPKTVLGLADGTVTWYRILNKDNTVVWDNNSVGTSGTALVLNTTTISTNVDVTANSHTVTMPAV